jgi:hypothetical protein
VFLDETWATTNMAPTRGRCPRGERLVCAVPHGVCAVPHGRWRTTTVLCGLRADGLVAPLVLDGAINGPAFPAYVEQVLAPTLRPGDAVVLDNLSSHKVRGVREAIEARGASLLYLPPYSPDLNPVRGTAPDAIGSSSPSASSNACSAPPPPAPPTRSGMPSLACSPASAQTSAPPTSATAAMHSQADKGLVARF